MAIDNSDRFMLKLIWGYHSTIFLLNEPVKKELRIAEEIYAIVKSLEPTKTQQSHHGTSEKTSKSTNIKMMLSHPTMLWTDVRSDFPTILVWSEAMSIDAVAVTASSLQQLERKRHCLNGQP